jgi:hypothetical protein
MAGTVSLWTGHLFITLSSLQRLLAPRSVPAVLIADRSVLAWTMPRAGKDDRHGSRC